VKTIYRLRVPDKVTRLLRGLHPELKQKLRTALDTLTRDARTGKPLHGELEGLRSLRVGRVRIVYRLGGRRVLEIVTVGPRERIYEETLRLIRKDRRT